MATCSARAAPSCACRLTTPPAFAEAVIRLADDSRLRQELGRRGREFVEANYAKPRILGHLVSRLDAVAAAQVTREILVFEPDVEGHSQEWLQHLVDFVATDDQAAAIAVLAPAGAVRDALAVDTARRRRSRPLHRPESRAR